MPRELIPHYLHRGSSPPPYLPYILEIRCIHEPVYHKLHASGDISSHGDYSMAKHHLWCHKSHRSRCVANNCFFFLCLGWTQKAAIHGKQNTRWPRSGTNDPLGVWVSRYGTVVLERRYRKEAVLGDDETTKTSVKTWKDTKLEEYVGWGMALRNCSSSLSSFTIFLLGKLWGFSGVLLYLFVALDGAERRMGNIGILNCLCNVFLGVHRIILNDIQVSTRAGLFGRNQGSLPRATEQCKA